MASPVLAQLLFRAPHSVGADGGCRNAIFFSSSGFGTLFGTSSRARMVEEGGRKDYYPSAPCCACCAEIIMSWRV